MTVDPVTHICEVATETLAGSGLAFAIVLWKPGSEAHPQGVACQTPTLHEREAVVAMRTAATCLQTGLDTRVLSS